jgi:menaquinol-cytochrome c reductase cytochrome b subunit
MDEEKKDRQDGREEGLSRKIGAHFRIFESFKFWALGSIIYGGLDRRLEFKDALAQALKHPVPKFVNWTFCFGGMTFFFFLVQVLTGILLTMYYQPSPQGAYQSVQFIMNDVAGGWLIRSVHRWAAEGMILLIFLHMLRVYFMGAYKHPRELNWIVGLFLLMITMGFGFTGYLLPWDQKAFWATTVGSDIAGYVPFIGPYIKLILRGSESVSGTTLTRFYSFHVIVFPLMISFFLISHFFMIRKQGVSEPL